MARLKIIGMMGAVTLGMTATASAQQLVYTPTNPSFGGNPFNSAHLLGVANAQNDFEAPEDETMEATQADIFLRQLQSRLLSGLASDVTNAIFGDNPQESGTISFGGQTISFLRGLDSVTITIFDAATGTNTEIILPLFAAN